MKGKKVFILFYFVVCFGNVNAQNLYQIMYYLNGQSFFNNIVPIDSDSSYLLSGPKYTSAIAAKADNFGNINWLKEYQFSSNLPVSTFFIYPESYNNKYLIKGQSLGFDSAAIFHVKPFIGLIDTSGSIFNLKQINITTYDQLGGAVKTLDGGFAAVGVLSFDDFYDTIVGNMFLLKLDAQLNQEWCRVYYDTAITGLSQIIQLQNGDFILSGITQQYTYKGNWVIMRTDSVGNIIWCKRTDGVIDAEYFAQTIALTNDSAIGIAYGSEDPLLPGSDISFAKVDLNGNLLWHRIQGDFGGESPYRLFALPDSGFWMDTGNLMRRYNANGDVLYAKAPTAGFYLSLSANALTKDGGFISAGLADSPNDKMIINKTDSAYNSACNNLFFNNLFSIPSGINLINYFLNDSLVTFIESPLSYVTFDSVPTKNVICTNVSTKENTFIETTKVYPNPCFSHLNITSEKKIKSIDIYNYTGQIVLHYEINESNSFEVNVTSLQSNALYVCRISFITGTSNLKFFKTSN